MKLFLKYFAAALLLLGAAAACEKNPGGGGTPPVPRDFHVDPSNTTLLELFQDQIDEYGLDATVPLKRVYICAHRANTWSSADKKIPENSVACIEEAIAQGVDMVELDVRTTSDGVLMLMHDESVASTTNGSGKIQNLTYDQIRSFKMKYRGQSTPYEKDGQSIQVPTLVEALKACKGKIDVNLDVKNTKVSSLMAAIHEAGSEDEVMIYGFSQSEKKECIEWAIEKYGKFIAVHPYIGSPSECKTYQSVAWYDCAKLFQYSGSTYYNATTPQFGYQCHAMGALSYSNSLDWDKEIKTWYSTYYVNDIEAPCKVLDQFIAAGSDIVQTDCFELAELYLKFKGLRQGK